MEHINPDLSRKKHERGDQTETNNVEASRQRFIY